VYTNTEKYEIQAEQSKEIEVASCKPVLMQYHISFWQFQVWILNFVEGVKQQAHHQYATMMLFASVDQNMGY
jgi:hypothetical protein